MKQTRSGSPEGFKLSKSERKEILAHINALRPVPDKSQFYREAVFEKIARDKADAKKARAA